MNRVIIKRKMLASGASKWPRSYDVRVPYSNRSPHFTILAFFFSRPVNPNDRIISYCLITIYENSQQDTTLCYGHPPTMIPTYCYRQRMAMIQREYRSSPSKYSSTYNGTAAVVYIQPRNARVSQHHNTSWTQHAGSTTTRTHTAQNCRQRYKLYTAGHAAHS